MRFFSTEFSFDQVQRVLLALRTARWPVIDFYTAVCDPAHYMRWTHGTTYDAGHPNGKARLSPCS